MITKFAIKVTFSLLILTGNLMNSQQIQSKSSIYNITLADAEGNNFKLERFKNKRFTTKTVSGRRQRLNLKTKVRPNVSPKKQAEVAKINELIQKEVNIVYGKNKYFPLLVTKRQRDTHIKLQYEVEYR